LTLGDPSLKGRNDAAGRRTKKETDRLCSDNEAGGSDGIAER
jgi:hypothetical protein